MTARPGARREIARRFSARRFAPLVLLLTLLLAGCPAADPSRWEAAQQASQNQTIVTEDVIPGGEFNRFFPEVSDPFDVVFLQEKEGFAEAGLHYEGTEVATLAVSDTATNPGALDKFEQSSETLNGYPLATVGSQGTAILVADRIQVQVRSKADDFMPQDRADWLLEFDLNGLAGLVE